MAVVSSMECRMIGALEYSRVEAVHEVLKSMSHSPVERIAYHELILKDPPRMHPASKVRLQCPFPLSVNSSGQEDMLLDTMTKANNNDEVNWTMRHEGKPMGSSEAAALPATIIEVVESKLKGSKKSVEKFWKLTMGLKLDYGLVKTGNRYHVEHDSFDIEVLICRLRKLSDPMKPENAKDLVGGSVLMELVTKSTKEGFREAARAVGSFCDQLSPYAEFIKAA